VRDELVGRQRLYELDAGQFTQLIAWLAQFIQPLGSERHLDALETAVYRTSRERRARSSEGEHCMNRLPAGELFRTGSGSDLVLTGPRRRPASARPSCEPGRPWHARHARAIPARDVTYDLLTNSSVEMNIVS